MLPYGREAILPPLNAWFWRASMLDEKETTARPEYSTHLFKRTLDSKHKEELMVFLTPRVVSGLNTAGLPTAGELWQDRHQGG